MKTSIKLLLLFLLFIGLVFAACGIDSGAQKQTADSAMPETADDYATCLLTAIENGNAPEVASLFSESVLSTDPEASAEEMLGYIQGVVVSWDYKLGMTSASNHQGKVQETDVTMNIKTDANAYRLAIRIRVTDEGHPENVGIISLYITEAANTNMDFAYWGGYEWELGIHVE